MGINVVCVRIWRAEHTILWKRGVDVLDGSVRPWAHLSRGPQLKEVASAAGQALDF